MTILKIREQNLIRRTRLDNFSWHQFTQTVKLTVNKLSLSSYDLICNRPVEGLIIQSQTDLEVISNQIGTGILDISLTKKPDSSFTQIMNELLDIPSNKEFVKKRIRELNSGPAPSKTEKSLKEKFQTLINEARCKKQPFRLVYVTQGDRKVLKPTPTRDWINYSTTSLQNLTRSLPANIVNKLKEGNQVSHFSS